MPITPPSTVQIASARFSQPVPIRRGSVSERFVKCSKAGCPCATDGKARHGPYYSWTRVVNGKTQSRLLTREQAAAVKKQIEAAGSTKSHLQNPLTLWETELSL